MLNLRILVLFIYVVLLTVINWFLYGQSLRGIDDAGIYFVYMRNLVHHHGFVYNIGGEHVEGFTSLLWTLVGSFIYLFTDYPETLLVIINMLLLTYSLFRVVRYIDGNLQDVLFSSRALFFLFLVGITSGFIGWTILSLLETGLWCFLITNTTLQIIEYTEKQNQYRHYLVLFGLYILLILCRPESILWVPIFIVMNAMMMHFNGSKRKIVVYGTFFSLLIYVLTLLILVAWRLYYFGYPFPNTYYAKVSSDRIDNIVYGLKYLYQAAWAKPIWLFIGIHVLYTIIRSIRKLDIQQHIVMYILCCLVGVTMLIPLYTGGDHYVHQRFIMPSLLIMYLLWLLIFPKSILQKPIYLFLSAIGLVLLQGVFFFINKDAPFFSMKYDFVFPLKQYEYGNMMNRFFKQNNRLPSVGVLSAGAFAYNYRGETIDILGLNNTRMAHAEKSNNMNKVKNHASFNKKVFYELQPDLFVMLQQAIFNTTDTIASKKISIDTTGIFSLVFKNIHLDADFKQQYRYCKIKNKYLPYTIQIFAHERFIHSLDTCVYTIQTIPYE
jgi:hypothetical protein